MKILDLTNPKHQQIVVEEIARAKQIISEQSSPKLSKHKIAKWFANNRKLVSDFVYIYVSGLNSGVKCSFYSSEIEFSFSRTYPDNRFCFEE